LEKENTCTCAAHVEADDWDLGFWIIGSLSISNDTASRTAQNGSQSGEFRDIHQTTV
jgi:hypothetical protein